MHQFRADREEAKSLSKGEQQHSQMSNSERREGFSTTQKAALQMLWGKQHLHPAPISHQ